MIGPFDLYLQAEKSWRLKQKNQALILARISGELSKLWPVCGEMFSIDKRQWYACRAARNRHPPQHTFPPLRSEQCNVEIAVPLCSWLSAKKSRPLNYCLKSCNVATLQAIALA